MSPLEEVNQAIEDTQKLILIRTKGLQKLKEQEANFGLNLPIHLSNEIDMFEEKLEELYNKLENLKEQQEALEPPLVHLHTFGTLEGGLSDNAQIINWNEMFDRTAVPRKVPGPEVWQQQLWPELRDFEQMKIGQKGLIRLQGTIALSAGFAFGRVFSQEGQYQLQVKQGPQLWRSDEAWDKTGPTFAGQEIMGAQSVDSIAVVINALQDQDSDDLVAEIKTYLNNEYGGVRKILLFEAEKAVEQKDFLTGAEAAILARTSKPRLRKFVKQNSADILHVFLATPAGLAVFLGHYWNAIGITAQFHEWTGKTGEYTPSCRVLLN